MFNSEREMQDKFIEVLKQMKTCGNIFEEVGNADRHCRIDVVEYKKDQITAYELKLKDYGKVFDQAWKLRANNLVNRVYVVFPKKFYDINKERILEYKSLHYRHIGIITFDGKKIVKVKPADQYGFKSIYESNVIRDLIIRGFHKDGINCRKSYK